MKYSVAEVSAHIGVARSTLLYYERIDLVVPARDPANGYRVYSEEDVNRLVLLKQLQKSGLTLSACRQLVEGAPDLAMIEERLNSLDREIMEMQTARDLLRSMYARYTGHTPDDSGDLRAWHASFEKRAAQAHFHWLQQMGFSAKDALYIRWVSRDMNNNEEYMAHFFSIFERMNRQGPGSDRSTLSAFEKIPADVSLEHILDIGCGRGAASLALANACTAQITAVDNHKPFLTSLARAVQEQKKEHQIHVQEMDMNDLHFPDGRFDLIWAEGCAYIIGVSAALRQWKRLLRDGGFLYLTDVVWVAKSPSAECRAYWEIEYPQMVTADERLQEAEAAGYRVVHSCMLPRSDWAAFYDEMERQLKRLPTESREHRVYRDMKEEIQIDRTYGDEYGCATMLLQKRPH